VSFGGFPGQTPRNYLPQQIPAITYAYLPQYSHTESFQRYSNNRRLPQSSHFGPGTEFIVELPLGQGEEIHREANDDA
jgi:hypothetical protein